MNKLILDQNYFKVYKIQRPIGETDNETEKFLASKKTRYDIFNTINPIVLPTNFESFEKVIENIPCLESELIDEEIVKRLKGNRQVYVPCNDCTACGYFFFNFIEFFFISSYKYFDEEEFWFVKGCYGEKPYLYIKDLPNKGGYRHATSAVPFCKYKKPISPTKCIEYQEEFYDYLECNIESFRILCEKIKNCWDSNINNEITREVEINNILFRYNLLDENLKNDYSKFTSVSTYEKYTQSVIKILPLKIISLEKLKIEPKHWTDYIKAIILYKIEKTWNEEDPKKVYNQLIENYNLGNSGEREQIELALEECRKKNFINNFVINES